MAETGQVPKGGIVERVRAEGWSGRYEEELLLFLEEEYGALPDEILTGVLYLSLFVRAGHVCLPLDRSVAGWRRLLDLEPEAGDEDRSLSPESLLQHPAVGGPLDDSPFVVEGSYLYMRKHYRMQEYVREELERLSSEILEDYNPSEAARLLRELFPGTTTGEVNWQKTAAALSLRNRLLIISGGPGTGKTTTVSRILRLLEGAVERPLRIALAAPTGKAAARMPGEAVTLHRLLGRVRSRGLLPPVERERLPYDLIVVDEASMIDLALMESLLRHLERGARLILIGDKDQLASVEAGAVLSDICRKTGNYFSSGVLEFLNRYGAAAGVSLPPTEEQGKELAGAGDSTLYLTRSYRFGETSGIGRLADAVRRQDREAVSEILTSGNQDDLFLAGSVFERGGLAALMEQIGEQVRQARGRQGDQLLDQWHSEIRLGVLRRGPWGTDILNRMIEEYLFRKRIIPRTGWYHGRPVLINRNDYTLGVFNGDPGICLAKEGTYYLYFRSEEGKEREIPAHRIHHYEPAWVLTVHKSQGSEFDRVHLLLPGQDTPLLTRELIYTAITRARKEFRLHGDPELLLKGVARKTARFTGSPPA